MPERYWLVKSEPGEYSIDDLAREIVGRWDGVRSYQARIFIRDQMQIGDGVLFYHSSVDPPGLVGTARVASAARPDPTQFDPGSPYHDPGADRGDPRWWAIDVEFAEKFGALIPLDVLRRTPGLEDMMVTRRGMRLSVQPVTAREWEVAVALGRRGLADPAMPASGGPAREASAKKAPAKGTARKASGRGTAARKAPATRAPAKKAALRRGPAGKASAKKGAAGQGAAGRATRKSSAGEAAAETKRPRRGAAVKPRR